MVKLIIWCKPIVPLIDIREFGNGCIIYKIKFHIANLFTDMLEQILCIFDICTLCYDTVCSSFDNCPSPIRSSFSVVCFGKIPRRTWKPILWVYHFIEQVKVVLRSILGCRPITYEMHTLDLGHCCTYLLQYWIHMCPDPLRTMIGTFWNCTKLLNSILCIQYSRV